MTFFDVLKYEEYLKSDEGKELDDYERGEHNVLFNVVQDLKTILNVNEDIKKRMSK